MPDTFSIGLYVFTSENKRPEKYVPFFPKGVAS
jgi:hypothetical protein